MDDNYHLKERTININRTVWKCEDDLKGALFSCRDFHLENDKITTMMIFGIWSTIPRRYSVRSFFYEPSWLCCAETPVAAMRTWGLRLTQPIFLKEDWLIVKREFLSFDKINPQEEDWQIVSFETCIIDINCD